MADIPVESNFDLLLNEIKKVRLENRGSTDTANRAIGRIWLNTTSGSERINFDIVNSGNSSAITVPRLDLAETVTGL